MDDARFERSAPEQVRPACLPEDLWGTLHSLTQRASRLRARANLVEYRAERMTDEGSIVEGLAWVARLRRQADDHECTCHGLVSRLSSPPDPRTRRSPG